jgi:hypothetical protein
MSISREPPRTFCPFVGEEFRHLAADIGILPGRALRIGRDEARHETDVEFRQLAARIRHRIKAHVERAFAHRRELRVRLHQRRVRIDLGNKRTVGTLGDFLCEFAAKAVAEVALIDRAAGELVRDFERLGCLAA